MLTSVKYTGFPCHVLAVLFPEIDYGRVPLYADDAPGARSRFEFDREQFRVIHPVDDFGNVPVMVHEYAHMATLMACGHDVVEQAPEYRLEAAALFAEQALALNFPAYLPAVYERLYTRVKADVWAPLADAMRTTIAPTPLRAIQMIAEGQHG